MQARLYACEAVMQNKQRKPPFNFLMRQSTYIVKKCTNICKTNLSRQKYCVRNLLHLIEMYIKISQTTLRSNMDSCSEHHLRKNIPEEGPIRNNQQICHLHDWAERPEINWSGAASTKLVNIPIEKKLIFL